MTTKRITPEPILEVITIRLFIAEVVREFKQREKVRGGNGNKNWWKKKPEDVALVSLGAWFRQMLKEGNGVRRQKKEVDKMLAEVERELGMRERLFPYWIKRGLLPKEDADKWIIQLNEIKHYLTDYNNYHFNNQTQLAL